MEEEKKFSLIRSFRARIIIFIVSIAVVNVSILGGVLSTQVYTQMKTNQTTAVDDVLKNYMTYLDQFFNDNEASLKQFAQNYYVKNILKDPETNSAKLINLFKDFQDSHPLVQVISYGTETGQYYFDPARNSVPAGYDPRKRPWYTLAKETDNIAYTSVYADANTGKNIMTIVKKIRNDDNEMVGVLGIVLRLDTLEQINNSFKIGEKGYTFLTQGENYIAHNNKELVNKKITDKAIYELSVSKKNLSYTAVSSEKGKTDTEYVKCNYYPKIGWTIWSIGYKSDLLAPVYRILYKILFVGLFILLCTIIAAAMISKIMTKNIEKILKAADTMSTGDMSQELILKSNDEFELLAQGFEAIRAGTKRLVEDVKHITVKILDTSSSLVSTANQSSAASEEISGAIEHIAVSSESQVQKTEEISSLLKAFSCRLDVMTENFSNVNKFAGKIINQVSDGVENMSILNNKTQENIKSTSQIENMVNNLAGNIKNIDEILKAIKSISEQTNLLALNASIEAARAGKAGRGFSVVAEEIRKLAENSGGFVQKIKEIIDVIQQEAVQTVSNMRILKKTAEEQTGAVFNANDTFDSIKHSIKEIDKSINLTLESVTAIDEDNGKIVRAISDITASSSENAASIEQLSASAEEQTASDSVVTANAVNLQNYVKDLRKSLESFKV